METVQPNSVAISDESEAGAVARGFAFLGALVVLIIGAIFSLGAVLLAPAGMAIGAYVWRRRGRRLPVMGHWVAAACASTLVLLAYAGVAASLIPKGSWEHARQAADSAQKVSAKQATPAWLERIAPGTARRAAEAPTSERAQTFGIAAGAALATMFFVGFFGTVGWLGGMLLGFAFFGRWPGGKTAVLAG
ncbi:MAG TPA: hypothetical protein VGH98_19285 [Gemmatimonadaceae bacterium]|jgi:hypothetical protein